MAPTIEPDDPENRAAPDEAGPAAWELRSSEHGADLLLFRPRWDSLVNPRTGATLRRLVLETPDWVNVVARTDDERLVVIRQYRFGTRTVETEIPGGIVDAGEEHGVAARRELREESGFTARSWRYLGYSDPNPAFLDNRCHHWLADGATRTHELELDPGEDIQAAAIPIDEALKLVREGRIRHSLVVAALARVYDLSLATDTVGASNARRADPGGDPEPPRASPPTKDDHR